jgi:hypothetical protein
MKSDIERTRGSVRASLPASARLATVGSKAVGTRFLRSRERGDDREEISAAASVNGGWRIWLDDKSNTRELRQASLNPKEPKTLTGSGQKATQPVVPPETEGTRTLMAAGVIAGTKSSVLLERNMENPSSRLEEAGDAARRAVGVTGRGSWKKPTPFCNGTDRSCNITPLRKQAHFQPVVGDETACRTFTGGNGK